MMRDDIILNDRDANEVAGAIEMLKQGRDLESAIVLASMIKEQLERNRMIDAVIGLKQFTLNWCSEPEKGKNRFRCNECCFSCGEQCFIKLFVHNIKDEDIKNIFDTWGEEEKHVE